MGLATLTSPLHQKFPDHLHEALPLLEMRHVRRFRELNPLDLVHMREENGSATILRFVISAVQQKDRYVDCAQFIECRPSSERTGHIEFGWAPPVVQDMLVSECGQLGITTCMER